MSDEYGLVKGAVEERKKNKGALVAVSDSRSGRYFRATAGTLSPHFLAVTSFIQTLLLPADAAN